MVVGVEEAAYLKYVKELSVFIQSQKYNMLWMLCSITWGKFHVYNG